MVPRHRRSIGLEIGGKFLNGAQPVDFMPVGVGLIIPHLPHEDTNTVPLGGEAVVGGGRWL